LYEAFYIIHISLFIRPDITFQALIIIIFAASIRAYDRIIRLARKIWHAYGNNASIMPLPQGGIGIVLRYPARHAVPGLHIFL
jgi:hypothetical protein